MQKQKNSVGSYYSYIFTLLFSIILIAVAIISIVAWINWNSNFSTAKNGYIWEQEKNGSTVLYYNPTQLFNSAQETLITISMWIGFIGVGIIGIITAIALTSYSVMGIVKSSKRGEVVLHKADYVLKYTGYSLMIVVGIATLATGLPLVFDLFSPTQGSVGFSFDKQIPFKMGKGLKDAYSAVYNANTLMSVAGIIMTAVALIGAINFGTYSLLYYYGKVRSISVKFAR